MSYTGLHIHTVFSLLDGFCKIPDLVKKAKELEWPAVAITDHNHLGGIPDFKQECDRQKIKGLFGMEGYYTPNTRLLSAPVDIRNKLAERDAVLSGQWTKEDIASLKSTDKTKLHKKFGYDTTGYHILFIAKNQQGWSNLVKLQSESSRLCTFNGRYHCDLKLLEKYHEGLIVTTACVGSYPSEMICTKRERFAAGYLNSMKQIFGDDFYLEIQPLNIKRQQQTNWFYYGWGQANGVKTIATNDSHWINRDDALDHDVLLCVGLYEKLANPARMHYDPVFWVRSEEEMLEAFEEQADNMVEKIPKFKREAYLDYCQTALNTTQEIVDKVDPDIRLGSEHHLFPAVSVKDTPEQVLREKATEGLNNYLAKNKNLNVSVYKKRLAEELDIICSKGFAPYFLAIEELISWCDSVGIPTGPGRGSAAGSLVLLCLGVTKKVDPIEMKLWFSRFMTKDRKDMPDVDLDVSWLNRDKAISHLEEVYGKPCVSHIGTFSTLKVKSSIKDVARVLDVPFVDALKITKEIDAIDDDPNLSFSTIDSWKDGTLDERAKYKRFSKLEEQYPDIFSFARKFEGIPRQMGVHASGILVTPMAVSDIFPVRYVDGVAVTLYTGVQVDEFNACKLDVLGLKTLDIIDMTLKSVDPKLNIGTLYNTVDITDSKVYDMIRDKKTDAVFQLESDTMKGIIGIIKPTNFEDIVVINSVARPGPLSCNMHVDYAKRKAGEEKISYPISGCEDILGPTYGIIPYQENLMAISKRVAGFDDTQADSLMRKCIAKKKPEMMYMLQRCFIYGKKNCEGPEGWEEQDDLPWYDPKGKYSGEIDGGIARGYTKEEIENFFVSIKEYSSYCFNRSHAACYSMIGILTAWLKLHYPANFWAAVLSITEDSKRDKYLKIIKEEKIKVSKPDINVSGLNFTATKDQILYGIGRIKGVGEATVMTILKERKKGPFANLADIIERVPKKVLRQNVITALIKAGAFDYEHSNRYLLLNRMLDIRKDKKTIRFNEEDYCDAVCQNMETEVLGSSITHPYWWDDVEENEKIEDQQCLVTSVREHTDKNGKLMCFCSVMTENCSVDCVMFASRYLNYGGVDLKKDKEFLISGKKSNGKLLISRVRPFSEM